MNNRRLFRVIERTLRFFNKYLLQLSWPALLVILFLHFFVCWILMWLAAEQQLVRPDIWFYFFITTATTVGYGDLSPSTEMGRWVASVIMMPGAVVLFAAFLGKLSSFFIAMWRKGMQGQADYSELSNHMVIFGWDPETTPRMIQLIFGDTRRQNRALVLCAVDNIENPLPDRIRFVRGERLIDEDVFQRAAVRKAGRIIIHLGSDDQTLAMCLAVCATDTLAHIVAWFENDRMAQLVKSHCPQVECETSLSVDLMVRAAQDPGSSRLQSQLLSTLKGPTQFSVQVPEGFTGTSFGQLLKVMKIIHEAIVLGVANSVTGDDLYLNPPADYSIKAGQLVYFMAAERIRSDEVNWPAMCSSVESG
ncbi:hypothetical protein CI610_03080 [invertebrate metagenome]|uniref:Potassium channel domain-containing protein n=1 Tax=invertebrate metagenome TaxID=1711999 RepID=A0A2H9T466_9ZZZZ